MAKIETIHLTNFKAITDLKADFKGCTAIITGGNNKGKTSFIRGILDRIRFVRPEIMLKTGEKEGRGELILDNGDRFIWEFSDTLDKLMLITRESRRSVTKEIGRQFFPPLFDIDKFLQSSPKDQVKQLQAIVGLDFTEIDERYRKAYDARTERNREAELYHVKLEKMIKCDRVEFVDLTELKARKENERQRLNALYLTNKKHNEELRGQWENEKKDIDKQVFEYNSIQNANREASNACSAAYTTLMDYGYEGQEVGKFLFELSEKIKPHKIATDLYPKEPTYIEEMPDKTELDKIDASIEKAVETNAAAQKYKEWIDHKNATEAARDAADQADLLVKSIEQERVKMLEKCKLPDGISFTADGITVDGLPLDRNQISTSKLYCAALKIASINLGEVRTLYFDASFLDKFSLGEIQEWAIANDLQLLIERPDYDGGEIKYELLES